MAPCWVSLDSYSKMQSIFYLSFFFRMIHFRDIDQQTLKCFVISLISPFLHFKRLKFKKNILNSYSNVQNRKIAPKVVNCVISKK